MKIISKQSVVSKLHSVIDNSMPNEGPEILIENLTISFLSFIGMVTLARVLVGRSKRRFWHAATSTVTTSVFLLPATLISLLDPWLFY